ncbi:MAG: hypothetical protein LQ351_006815 [Letrouitia transgressa]|nr:MAG: hypothetical protein LQ351_006815 [Letrouitia transgressa]
MPKPSANRKDEFVRDLEKPQFIAKGGLVREKDVLITAEKLCKDVKAQLYLQKYKWNAKNMLVE